MKKLSAILSMIVIAGFVHQGMIFAAEAAKEKKIAKTNFTCKAKHKAAPAPVAPPTT